MKGAIAALLCVIGALPLTNDGGAMQAVVHGVSDQDIAALAHYIANLN